MVVERREVGGVVMEELLTGIVDRDGGVVEVVQDSEDQGVVRCK